MEYELRVVVEKVLVRTQEVVKRDTLKTYEVKPPASILELGLRPAEQISLLVKVQDAILAVQAPLIDPGHDVCPRCSDKLKKKGFTPECHLVSPHLCYWPITYAALCVGFASRDTVWDIVCGHAVRTDRGGGDSRPARTVARCLAPRPAIGRHR